MQDTVQMTVRVTLDTKNKIRDISRATYRKPGSLIAFLVAEAWEKLQAEKINAIQSDEKEAVR